MAYRCGIKGCTGTVTGATGSVFTLDNGRTIHVCPRHARSIRSVRKAQGKPIGRR